MFNTTCNIDKTDRINRAVIGAIIFLAAIIGFGPVFFCLLGLVLVIEGIIGWCSIPIVTDWIKSKFK